MCNTEDEDNNIPVPDKEKTHQKHFDLSILTEIQRAFITDFLEDEHNDDER